MQIPRVLADYNADENPVAHVQNDKHVCVAVDFGMWAYGNSAQLFFLGLVETWAHYRIYCYWKKHLAVVSHASTYYVVTCFLCVFCFVSNVVWPVGLDPFNPAKTPTMDALLAHSLFAYPMYVGRALMNVYLIVIIPPNFARICFSLTWHCLTLFSIICYIGLFVCVGWTAIEMYQKKIHWILEHTDYESPFVRYWIFHHIENTAMATCLVSQFLHPLSWRGIAAIICRDPPMEKPPDTQC